MDTQLISKILVWDGSQQPTWPTLSKTIEDIQNEGYRVYINEIDTDSDDYAILVSNMKMEKDRAQTIYTTWLEQNNYPAWLDKETYVIYVDTEGEKLVLKTTGKHKKGDFRTERLFEAKIVYSTKVDDVEGDISEEWISTVFTDDQELVRKTLLEALYEKCSSIDDTLGVCIITDDNEKHFEEMPIDKLAELNEKGSVSSVLVQLIIEYLLWV